MDDFTRRMIMGAAGGSSEKTYVDDVFSTLIFEGNNTYPRTVTNGINFSEEGGLIIGKARTNAYGWVVWDTARGAGDKALRIDSTQGENGAAVGPYVKLEQFNSDGFRLGQPTSQDVFNANGENGVFWSFRKTKGFFDVVTYSGDGTDNRSISHSLGSSVGMMIIKVLNHADDWLVWHKDLDDGKALLFNTTNEALGFSSSIPSDPTSSSFTVSSNVKANASGKTYVCYLFAGGESIDDTARSVDFDGTSDYLSTASSSDLTLGTGDFTVECWMKWDSEPAWNQLQGAYQISTNSNGVDGTYAQTPGVGYYDTKWKIYGGGGSGFVESGVNKISPGTWYHVAHVRASSVSKLYLNGVEIVSMNDSYNYTGTYMAIGAVTASSGSTDGSISNMRVVKGTALYTSSFRPPTKPLTNISGTSILCCNNSSTTGKTVGPTLTANGTLAANTSSPFDDPDSFKFGDARESVIKCGNYMGSGSVGNEVFLGFEPQWVLIKCTSHTGGWRLFDSMRGIVSGGNDAMLQPNSGNAEVSNNDWIDVTPTGFILQNTDGNTNGGGFGYIYITIRRPDGYVGKPAEAGTDVFAMDTWIAGADPAMISNFPVDFVLDRNPTYSGSWQGNWHVRGRLIQNLYLQTQSTAAEGTGTWGQFDYSNGWLNRQGLTGYTNWQSWMWKRHAGFDVVAWEGNSVVGRQMPHNLSKTPEMFWVKMRTGGTNNWAVYHKGLNGGTNPQNYSLQLNTSAAENSGEVWQYTAPTSTHVTLSADSRVNLNGRKYIAMLFASVPGISALGSYTGNATDSDHSSGTKTITFGFQPRFVIIKSYDANGEWVVLDTLRGWASGSGNTKRLRLNLTNAQNNEDAGYPTATGMVLTGSGSGLTNYSGQNYIYYAHA